MSAIAEERTERPPARPNFPLAYPSAIPRPGGTLPRAVRGVLSLEDLEPMARRHLPRFLFGFISGGVETNAARDGNRAAFAARRLVPRMLVDTTTRRQTTTLFGRSYASAFGIAPMGGAALAAFEGDLQLARAAAEANIPYVLSGASLIRLEDIIAANPHAWFQAYIPGDRVQIGALVERVGSAGYETLVVTADVPVPANRENNVRNGWSLPLRPTPRLAYESLIHPHWLLGTALATLRRNGMPHFENMAATRGAPVLSPHAERSFGRRDALNWADIAWIRRRWPGKLVVKGLLAPEDAQLAREAGCDGIIVSNHGGRQLDFSIASLDALAAVKAEAGEMCVMLDGGVRRGTDLLKALALGADFVFLGRPFLYAASLGGKAGVRLAISLFSEEIDRDLALVGCRELGALNASFLSPHAS
ncbi:MAG TPA: alpha-hydroxy acid oxidase [Acetobacteraceae bacterium]|nr:alpha-hydroxy acid oxidase [Acetobacteraceae bacterium]